MAEAVVEDPMRFFCHRCNVAINRVLPEFKCPNCNTGFIEELEVGEQSDAGSDSDMNNAEALIQLVQLHNMLSRRPSDNSRSRRSNGATPSATMQPSEPQLQDVVVNLTGVGRSGGGAEAWNNGPANNGGTPTGTTPSLAHLIQDVVVNLTGVGWAAGGAGGQSNGPVFFLGNPGDYAWGQEGLDAIVSHLLNQMDGTGPPPLAKEKIEEIPTVNIVEDQVDKNLQCSVCWEDFRLGEPVRKLRCEHVYHENCIIPWLELHGTCPICRKTLCDESAEEHPGQGETSMQNSLAALFRAARDSVSSRSTPSFSFSPTLSNSSASSSGTSSSSSQHSDQNHDCHLTDLE